MMQLHVGSGGAGGPFPNKTTNGPVMLAGRLHMLISKDQPGRTSYCATGSVRSRCLGLCRRREHPSSAGAG
jgi:hypothetical protein